MKFIHENLSAPKGFAYYYWDETMVIVYQRDSTGTEYKKYYLFTREQPAIGGLVSEQESDKWLSQYRLAEEKMHVLEIEGLATDISAVGTYF